MSTLPDVVGQYFTSDIFSFSLVQLGCQVGVLYHPPPSSPVLSVSLLQTALVHSGVARIFCGEVLFTNKRNFFVGVSQILA